jgi:predicted lysophospholipase L1 biosynthesis ABC-type transport system permease subunit
MASDLEWKAYQTYADGTVVSWDQKEEAHTDTDSDDAASGPLSVTKVTAETDAVTNEQASADELKSTKRTAQFALYTAIAALVITLVAIAYAVKK